MANTVTTCNLLGLAHEREKHLIERNTPLMAIRLIQVVHSDSSLETKKDTTDKQSFAVDAFLRLFCLISSSSDTHSFTDVRIDAPLVCALVEADKRPFSFADGRRQRWWRW